MLVWMGLALAVLELVQLVEAVLQGSTVPSSGPQGISGGYLYRLGVALFSDIDAANSLVLVLSVALVTVPLAFARRLHDRVSSAVTTALGTVLVVSVLMGIGSVLAVRARLHLYYVSDQAVTTVIRYSLFSYLIGTLGPALIALAAATAGLRWRRRPRSVGPGSEERPAGGVAG